MELFDFRSSKNVFGNYLRSGESKYILKSMENLSNVPCLRLQQLHLLELINRAKPTQLGSCMEHKFDWPSRGLKKAKASDLV